MFTRFSLRQIERAGLEHAASLPRFLFQFLIQVHGIVLDTADVCTIVQAVDIGRRMPCGSRCQFIPFQHHHIGPS